MADPDDAATEAKLSSGDTGVILELSNLINGAVSGTLSMLVDPAVTGEPPEVVEFESLDACIAALIPENSVLACVRFQNGLEAPMAYVLDAKPAITLANALIGGGSDEGPDISDIQLSAVGEAISQIMGAASSGMSQFLSKQVDISAPEVVVFSKDKLLAFNPDLGTDGVVVVQYKVRSGTTVPDCDLLQITTHSHMRQQIKTARAVMIANDPTLKHSDETVSEPIKKEDAAPEAAATGPATATAVADPTPRASTPPPVQPSVSNTVTAQSVEFPSFDDHVSLQGPINKNLELVMDVCLNLTVELGRTELPIKDILELTRGSVIELSKVAGEAVDLYANGKMIAKGEVVVIEDNFGLRITSIVAPADRLRGLS